MSEARILPVHVPGSAYDVVVGAGLLGRTGEFVAEVLPPTRVAIVTDDVVAPLYLAVASASLSAAGFEPVPVIVPSGEGSKSLAECERIWTLLGEERIERSGGVIALGGGVVGDLAGFCASAWLRGVPVVQVPTTVLAMADASIGGKTGVNLALGKNLVGSFHQPLRVIADVETLATLERRDLSAGLAEVVKCAILDDRAALARLRRDASALLAADASALEHAVLLAAETKIRLVSADPRETGGLRVLLNLGHTTAHALETERGHGELRHGEAVAIGLVVAARLAIGLGLSDAALLDDVVATLALLDLPVALPAGVNVAGLVRQMAHDKKRASGERRMVVPLAEGGARVVAVDDDALLAALGA